MTKEASAEGTEFVHRSVGRAKARANLDALRPGDPGYGEKASSELPQPKGVRVETTKGHQLSEDHDPEDLVRVIAPHPNKETHPDGEVVLFSGTTKQFNQLKKAISKASKAESE